MQKLERFLRDLLLRSGARLMKHFGRVKTIQFKAGAVTNLVTNVDRDIELFLKKAIRKEFPEDSLLAEESELEKADGPRRWVIDPLDGTTNFAHGLPLFCISVGVEVDGKVAVGG